MCIRDSHITELLSVLLLASEIGNHVPEILIEVAGPFFVAVTSIDLSLIHIFNELKVR